MKHVTIRMSRQDALELGLLSCNCGHPFNNHYDRSAGCAHCECEQYQEKSRRGKLVKYKSPRVIEKLVRLTIRSLYGDDIHDEIFTIIDRHWRKISKEFE